MSASRSKYKVTISHTFSVQLEGYFFIQIWVNKSLKERDRQTDRQTETETEK